MAIVVKNDGDLVVANIAQRNDLPKRYNGMQVTVLDATDDPILESGKAMYQWSTASSDWDLIWSESYGTARFVSELQAVTSNISAIESRVLSLESASGSSSGLSAVLTATQVNSTLTPQTLNNHVFVIPPLKTLQLSGQLIATAAATSTGIYYGIKATQGAGANGSAVGSWFGMVNVSSAQAATGLSDGDVINLIGGATVSSGILGTATTAGNVGSFIQATIRNTSSNANTTVELQFRSEVNNSAVTAQIGTAASGFIS